MHSLDLAERYLPVALLSAVWAAGALLAVSRWHRHPGVSRLILIGCGLELVGLLGHVALDRVLLRQLFDGNLSATQYNLALTAARWSRMLLGIAGYVLFFCAAFGWRREAASFARPEED